MKTNENAEQGNWIKISRKILDWEWFQDANTLQVFMYLLLKANHKDGRWQGNEVKRGQHITSQDSIVKGTGLSRQQVRTSLAKLQNTGEINQQTNRHFTLITICKYDTYQGENENINQQTNQPPTNHQPTTNQPSTINNNDNNDNNDNNIPLKETIKENPAEGPSLGTGPSSGVASCEAPMRNENENLNSNKNSSLDPNKKLSSNTRIKKISSDDLIRYCNCEILNKNLGKDEESRIRELFKQHAPKNQETTLRNFALELLNALNEEFALKFKKKYSSKITSGKKNPFTVNDVLTHLYGHYSEKSVEGHKKEIEKFYAQLELNGFKAKSGNDVSLMKFLAWLADNIPFKTREQEAPFTKEDLKKALPNEDERVMEKLESKYDRYFKKGNWTTNKGNDVDLDMFTGFLRKTVIEELISEGYVPKENKNISRDGRKWFRVEDADEIIKKYSGRSKN